MFPEGTRRLKGLRKRHEARWHTGAARIALEAGVPLVPGRHHRHRPPQPARPAPRRLWPADPDWTTSSSPDLRGGRARSRPTGCARRSRRSRRRLVDERDRCSPSTATRSRIARSTRCRARSAAPAGGRGTCSTASPRCCSGSGRRSARARCRRLGHAHRSDLPTRGDRRLPGGPRVRPCAARAARPAPDLLAGHRDRLRQGAGYEADDFLAAAVAAERERGGTVLVATSDRDAFQLVGRRRHDPAADPRRQRARAHRPGRGAGALRRRARAGARLHRAPRRPVGQDPGARGVGAKTAASLLAAARDRSTRCSRPAGSRRRPTRSASTGTSRRSTRRRRSRRSRTREPDWAAGGRGRAGAGARAARRASRGGGIELISHPALARLHPTTGRHPERERAARRAARGARRRARGAPATRDADRARPRRPPTSSWSRRSTTRPGSTATRSLARRPGRRPSSPRAVRSRRSSEAASRSPARPGTTRSPTARWASASSATSRSPRATRRTSSGSSASRSSTGTCTTGTGPRRSSAATTVLVRLAAPVAVLPGYRWSRHERRVDAERPAGGRRGRRRVPRGVRRARRAGRAGLRPELVLVSAGSTRTRRTRSR